MGVELSEEEAARRIVALAGKGVRNLNLVTPEHFWPQLRRVMALVREAGVSLPWVWNSSGYARRELLEEQVRWADIFLPDFKYVTPELARACMGREDYPEVAKAAISFLVERVGFLRPFDEAGEMPASHGVLVRHLVLPGEVENSLRILDWLAAHVGTELPISVMRQFRPMPECFQRGRFTRMVSEEEYACVVEHAVELGFRRVFLQPDSGDPEFVPDFRQAAQPFSANRGFGKTRV